MTAPFTVGLVTWRAAENDLRTIRRLVFVEEQGVPAPLEEDGLDPVCTHVLARDAAGRPLGAGRMQDDGRIGRMAVLSHSRRRGIGAAMLETLRTEARGRALREVHLHAQLAARAFYERHGFVPYGEPYIEAGIPHIGMRARP